MKTAQKTALKWIGIPLLISTILLSTGCFYGDPNYQGGYDYEHGHGGYNDSPRTTGRRTLPN